MATSSDPYCHTDSEIETYKTMVNLLETNFTFLKFP